MWKFLVISTFVVAFYISLIYKSHRGNDFINSNSDIQCYILYVLFAANSPNIQHFQKIYWYIFLIMKIENFD